MPPSNKPEILSREVIGGNFSPLERVVFRRRRTDGAMSETTREILNVDDGVAILPYDLARGTIILIRQFRGVAFLKGGSETLVEACAGKLEGADPLTRVKKETEEETGIRLSATPRPVFVAYSSPGTFAERLHYFVAPYTEADRIDKGGGLVEEGEDIEVIETTLEAAIAMIERGEIIDAKTIALLYYAKATRLLG
ncbi:Nudix-type nucleoside diphosphatase, YffH/AdpP family [Beijerinckiaceae bacterium RH AL1]|nr:GDP-mannose pyrophosphatase [Beijerinckiaceae bacterium]VVB45326.1 Nudix-type nucleoside diphosphatase, YffH/AdpP family [Beijerinckiaceae bacterium RH CH11]VVB45404.1 Nudix-type nucleoside diphosphatase, YffH/AdpP family [Beijerinckiaceae bacterium RH AL8]VVC54809.1 Nudix-type nucleoside diphosphatase, YffH/AdpP family [Beijerinckiaceae bacterium RH AL1]